MSQNSGMSTVAHPTTSHVARAITESVDGVIRVPAVVRGQLRQTQTDVRLPEIEAAFARADEGGAEGGPRKSVVIGDAYALREPALSRDTMRASGEYQYQLVPRVAPDELVEHDIDELAQELYELSFESVLEYVEGIRRAFLSDSVELDRVKGLVRQTSEQPDPYVDAGFAMFPEMLSPDVAAEMVDSELAAWQTVGRRFLDSWVELPSNLYPAPVHKIRGEHLPPIPGFAPADAGTRLRALPTRQLHITAGNSPLVPLVSILRAIWTKSAATIKLPYGATISGAYLATLIAATRPDHPITKHLSAVYWPGGDEAVEQPLFRPGNFDRIVVWGAPDAVTSVTQRAAFTKTIAFNPRYGVSLIGHEAFDELEAVTARALQDTLVQSQKACIASQVHYVEASREEAERYARLLSAELARWDSFAPASLSRWQQGRMKRMRRGSFAGATWHDNVVDSQFHSAVVVMPDEFNVLEHPLCRLIVVRPVERIEDALKYLHPGVATAGMYPDARREALRTRVAARGVSNVVPLGHAGYTFPGMPHDGMMVLSELVDWKSG